MNKHSETNQFDVVSPPPLAIGNSTSRCEEAESYHSVVVVLNNRYRVIECRDHIQWIFQRRAGKRHGENRWEGFKYYRTRDALIASCRAIAGEIGDNPQSVLASLPPIVGGRS